MTGRATRQLGRCPNLAFHSKFLTQFFLIRTGPPIHGKDFIQGTQVWSRIPVTVDAPLHQQSIGLKDQRHLIDLPMASRASNALVHINAVIEIREISQAVYSYPLDGLARAIAFANRLEVIRVVEEHGVAIHTGFRGRNAGYSGGLHAGVTVAAIDAVVSHVMFVAELHRLFTRDVLTRHVRGIGHADYSQKAKSNQKESGKHTKSGNEVRAAMENLGHVRLHFGGGAHRKGAKGLAHPTY